MRIRGGEVSQMLKLLGFYSRSTKLLGIVAVGQHGNVIEHNEPDMRIKQRYQ